MCAYIYIRTHTHICTFIGAFIHPKGDQSWVFIGRTEVEAEAPVLWPPDAKS